MELVLALIGTGGAIVAIPTLIDHVDRFFAAMPWTSRAPDSATWKPLVADAIGTAWAFGLWHGGVLTAIFPDIELVWPVVALLGLVAFGLGSAAAVDGKRALRAPVAPAG